jgi:hypothetical protein
MRVARLMILRNDGGGVKKRRSLVEKLIRGEATASFK